MTSEILICNSNDISRFSFDDVIIKINETKPKHVFILSFGEYALSGGNEHYDFNLLNLICEKNDTTTHIIFGAEDKKYYEKINKYEKIIIHNWPTFLLHFTYEWMCPYYSNDLNNIKINKNFDKLFLSYNNKPHYHRCVLIDKIFQNGLENYGNISWCKLSDEIWSRGYYNFKNWQEKILNLDEFNETNHNDRTDFLINNNSFFFLVTESNIECEFITEKTFKPILTEQPFLCYGSKNQNSILKKYGFKLYDNIFDYSFDSEDDLEKRAEGVIQNIKNLKGMDLNKLYEENFDIILYNKKRAYELIIQDEYVPKIFKELCIKYDLKNNSEFIDKSYGFIKNILKNI